jgi:hypothetical protein
MSVLQKVSALIENPVDMERIVEQEVPMLCADWAAKDEDALIHTLGINLFAAMGRRLGYFSVAEFPVPRAVQWQRKLVRVDSAWFDRVARAPVLLAEFERLSLDTVQEKLTNLYVAAHGTEIVPDLLVLCVWSLDGQAVDLSWYDPRTQLPVPNGPHVGKPGSAEVIVLHAVFGRQKDRLHLIGMRRLA